MSQRTAYLLIGYIIGSVVVVCIRLSVPTTYDTIKDMTYTCRRAYNLNDGATENRCGMLIDRIQQNGEFEVLDDGAGNFWTESKF